MNQETHPLLNPELYSQAEGAAWQVYETAAATQPERRIRLMAKAARDVFRQAGTPYDAAHVYADSIACDILMLASRGGTRAQPVRP